MSRIRISLSAAAVTALIVLSGCAGLPESPTAPQTTAIFTGSNHWRRVSWRASLTVGPFGPVVWHMAPKSGCLLLVFSMSAAPVDAHDIYMHLKTPLGFHCCTGQDCRPAHYRSGGDGIEMLVDNRWLPVAGYDVMYRSLPGDTGETFGGHWCGRNIPIEGGYITYCAVLPPNSAAAHVPLGTTPHSH